jgi:hypothetical protein
LKSRANWGAILRGVALSYFSKGDLAEWRHRNRAWERAMTTDARIDIDVNSKVRVQLSDKGREILRSRHSQFERMLPATLRKAFDLRADEEGYVEMPLSEAMAAFGPFLATENSPIGSTIQIVQPAEEVKLLENEKPRRLLPFFGKK